MSSERIEKRSLAKTIGVALLTGALTCFPAKKADSLEKLYKGMCSTSDVNGVFLDVN